MAISVVMPALEMAQETGKLLAWRKKEGERVAKGEPLLEIETDKAVVEVEAPGDGVLAGVTADVGAVIPVGQTIAWLVAPGEKPPTKVVTAAPAARASGGVERSVVAATQVSAQPRVSAPQISPKARRIAKELGVDIMRLRGTGPDGTITTEDVQAFAVGKSAAASSGGEPLSQIARLMAERTTQSWTSVPHFFLVRDVDAGGLVDLSKKLSPEIEKTYGARMTITDLLIALVAKVLAKHPRMNSSWTGEGIRSNPEINISVAMAVKDGVVGTVIHKANTTQLGEISAQRRDLTERARAGRLRPADITGGTFTISNMGMFGVEAFTPIVNWPECAILGVGQIADRAVVRDGQIVARPTMWLSLTFDHRIVDGAPAARFLARVRQLLESPYLLFV